MANEKNKSDPIAPGSSKLKRGAVGILKQAGKELGASVSNVGGSDPLSDFIRSGVTNRDRKKKLDAIRKDRSERDYSGSLRYREQNYTGKTIKDITTRRLSAPKVSTGDERVDSEVTRVFSQLGGVVNDLQEQTRNAFLSIEKRTTSLEGAVKNLHSRVDKVQAGNKVLAEQIGDILNQIDGDRRRARSKTNPADLEKALADRRSRAQSMKRDEKGRFVKSDESSGLTLGDAAAGYGVWRGAKSLARSGARLAGRAALPLAAGAAVDFLDRDSSVAGNSRIGNWINKHIPGAASIDDWAFRMSGGWVGTSASDPRNRESEKKSAADSKPVDEVKLVSRTDIFLEADRNLSLSAKNDITLKATRIIFDGDVVFKRGASVGQPAPGPKTPAPAKKYGAVDTQIMDPRNNLDPASVPNQPGVTPSGSGGSPASSGGAGGSVSSPMGRSTGAVTGSDLGVLGSNPGGPLGTLIARGESGKRGYNAYNRGTARQGRAQIDFSQMTLGQVMAQQGRAKGDPSRLFAVGKYQVIPSTMRAAVKALGLDPNQKFTPELQEKIYRDYLIKHKQKAVGDFITGKSNNIHSALNGLASEWAAIADPRTGRSKYGGTNSASISSGQAAQALKAQRKAYQDAIASGMKPEDAYAKSFGVDPSGQSVAQAPGAKTASLDPAIGTNASKTKTGDFTQDDQLRRGYHIGGKLVMGGKDYTFGSGGAGLGSIPYGTHKIGKFDTGAERAAMGRSFQRDAFNLPMSINDPKIGRTQGGKRLGILIHGSSGSTIDQILTHGCLGISRKDWPEFKKNLIALQKKNGNLVLDIGPQGARIRPAGEVPQSIITRDTSQFIQQERGKQAPVAPDAMAAGLGISDIDRVTGSPVAGTELDDVKPMGLADKLGFRKSNNIDDRRTVDDSKPDNRKYRERDKVVMQQARKDMGLDFTDEDVDRAYADGRQKMAKLQELKKLDRDRDFQKISGIKLPGYDKDRHSELEQQYNKEFAQVSKMTGLESLEGYVKAGEATAKRLENPAPERYEARMPKPVQPDLDPLSEASGKRLTAQIKKEGVTPPPKLEAGRTQDYVDKSIRRPYNDAEAAGPTPGSDGYGSKRADPDGCAFCSV